MAPKNDKTPEASRVPPHFTHWLLKAEPDSRKEKGIDVKFSVEDFEKCKVTAWEGVRNHQAKNYLKNGMKLGQECLFYASNCKVPGITALAKVVKEGYPDHNAWDEKHPYFDPKSSSDSPTWFMVDLEFVSRLPQMVPLKFLQKVTASSYSDLPESVRKYLTKSHFESIGRSQLLSRGRLSVQGCEDLFYESIKMLGENGGWEDWFEGEKKGEKKRVKEGDETREDRKETKTTPAKKAKTAKKANQGEKDEAKEEKEDKPAEVKDEKPVPRGSRRSSRISR